MASLPEDVPMSDDIPFEDDVEAELEVDELDPSDEEPEPATVAAPPAPSSKKSSDRKPGQRTPGHSLFPATRVENILQANGVTTQNLAMSKEGQFMLSVATEEFIKLLAKYAYDEAKLAKSPSLIGYEHIALVPVVYQPEFAFLQDIIPRAMAIKYAMEFRERRLQELEDEDPALGGFVPPPYAPPPLFPPTASTSSSSKPSKSKKEKASANGKEKQANGHSSAKQKKQASTKTSRSASVSSKTESVSQRRSSRNGNGPSALSKQLQPSPLANGHTTETPDSEMVPEPTGDDSPWSGQPIGPASGFLQGPAAPFARSASASSSNPGRTIYSQTANPD